MEISISSNVGRVAVIKRGAINTVRDQIADRVGIERRSLIVNKNIRFSDLEANTIVGKNHKGAIVTVNDRAFGILKMKKTAAREATEVEIAINDMLEEWIPCVNKIISDNSNEFAEYKSIVGKCQIDFYFAYPYSPRERDVKGKLNGLTRQYLRK